MVVQAGLNLITSRMKDASKAVPSHMAIGSSSAVTQLGDTALIGTEHLREAGVVTVTNNRWEMSASFTAVADVSVGEIGIFNAAVGGDMLTRFIIPTTNFTAGGVLAISWFIYIGGA